MYGDLIILRGAEARVVRQSPFGRGANANFSEHWLRDRLFENPMALPFGAIDPSYKDAVPICREMRTDAGPIDALFVNERGLLTILECKLWRNPEARREVVGQVLDYARALAGMQYEDLSRRVNAALGTEGNTLFDLVQRNHRELEEHTWGDQVSRNLAQGRFLFIGLVEVAVFKVDEGEVVIQPRLLAKTVTVERSVVHIETASGEVTVLDPDEASERQERSSDPAMAAVRKRFWDEFIVKVKLEGGLDAGPRRLQQNSAKARLPLGQWITAYRAESSAQVGLWFQPRGDQGPEIGRRLQPQRSEIQAEIELPVDWEVSDGELLIRASRPAQDFVGADAMRDQHEWLAKYLKAFTRTLGPRLRGLENEFSGR